MSGSTLPEAAEKQKGKSQVKKSVKEAIEIYRGEEDLYGTISNAKIAEKFDVNRVTLANLEQETSRPLSEFNALGQSASERRHQSAKSGGVIVTRMTKN